LQSGHTNQEDYSQTLPKTLHTNHLTIDQDGAEAGFTFWNEDSAETTIQDDELASGDGGHCFNKSSGATSIGLMDDT
jgi:hypothetical protein